MSNIETRAAATGHRTARLVTLLLITMLVTGGLAYQAIDSARAQRATAEAVLHDYASFAAQQFVERVAREIGFYGLYPALTWMRAEDVGGRRPFGDLARWQEEAEPATLRQSLQFQSTLFRLDMQSGAIVATANPVIAPEKISAAVRLHSRTTFDDEWAYALLMPGPIAYTRGEGDSGGAIAYGTIVNPTQFEAYFRGAFTRSPLLPTTLIGSAPADSVLWAAVMSADGQPLFELAAPQARSAYALAATRSLGPQFGDVQVQVAIQPEMEGKLVIGGLPTSRIPLTIALMALTAGLIAITALQMHRERELARLRTEFVSNVSHELRTPLAQIRMFAETLLLGRVRTGDEQTRALRVIDKEARRLTTLVENVLHFSRVERRTMTVAPEPVDLADLIEEVVDTFRPLAATHDVTLDLDLHPVHATVDPGAVKQIVLNLLDNAVKYGPDGQTVTITVSQGDHRADIAVADEGPGIDHADRDRIWKRFHRLDAQRNTATAGAGIGLAVVRELATLHGGTAHVENGEHGARFVVRLPLTAAASAPQRTTTDRTG